MSRPSPSPVHPTRQRNAHQEFQSLVGSDGVFHFHSPRGFLLHRRLLKRRLHGGVGPQKAADDVGVAEDRAETLPILVEGTLAQVGQFQVKRLKYCHTGFWSVLVCLDTYSYMLQNSSLDKGAYTPMAGG